MPSVANRYAFCLFCEDHRIEVSGKTMMAGIYSAIASFAQFPAVLPRLIIHVEAISPAALPFKSIAVHVFHDGRLIAELPVSEEQIRSLGVESANTAASEDDESAPVPIVHFKGLIRFEPFQVSSEGLVTVRVVTEDTVLPAGALRFVQSPTNQQQRRPASAMW